MPACGNTEASPSKTAFSASDKPKFVSDAQLVVRASADRVTCKYAELPPWMTPIVQRPFRHRASHLALVPAAALPSIQALSQLVAKLEKKAKGT